jgi:hypothetical protein
MFNVVRIRLVASLIVLFVAIISFGSCSSTSRSAQPEPSAEPEAPRIDEAFDPVMLQDEDIEFPVSKAPLQSNERLPLSGETNAENPLAVENKLIDGFRVQLFATQDIEKATLEKKEVEFAFAEAGVEVYIEFDSPMYKVRLGDCTTREEAEQLRELARSKGYPTSWIVKTKVNSNPGTPHTDDADSGDF